ncbi:MAG: ATP-binding cassette domain-containing protein [Lachnospiraceae bacterium]|nr:MAG: ATP-binding cassette domain-containing protein [Lachnospiraceae bacterium]
MLTLENLSLFYEQDKKILEDITLQVTEGECILLTGESGSGKSSIINSINGLAFEYENARITGKVHVDGKDIKGMELYQISLMIASVFQNPKTHFFNVNTTLELLFYLENIGLDRKEMEIRMENMLKVFPIKHLLGRSIFELSGGEKQILCVASCYISGCKIIVLDEPSSNLDEKYIDILKEMLQILKEKGITLILAEHRIYYLMDVADRIIIIQNGRIKESFTRDVFLSLPDDILYEWGLRSKNKINLENRQRPLGKDLIIKKLICDFKDKGELRVENVSFDLGKIYGITGRNGCGKSSFLSAITGLVEKEKSDIVFGGRAIGKKERLKNSSLVMQDVNHQLFTESVEEEIKLGIKDLDPAKADKVLSGLGLMELKDRHPMSLSGGQKQRVAIASVLCKDSRFIVFDEPTSGMDYNNMIKISNLIKEMKTENNIIFIVSHDIEFLNATTDQNLCLEEFRVYK